MTRTRLVLAAWAAMLPAVAGCSRSHDPGESAPAKPEVHVAPVVSRVFTGGLQASGEWKAASESVILAPFDAVVETVSARPGERVERGHRLGWWRTYESDAAVRGAEILLQQARDPAAERDAHRAIAEARASIVRVPILAPATGTVIRRSAGEGVRLAAGAELLALVADQDVVFEARIPPDHLREVRIGAAATIFDDEGPPRAARVWTILPASGGDQTALVWLREEKSTKRADIGRFGTAIFALERAVTALAVPDSAVVEDDLTGEHRVATVDSSRVKWVAVTLGPREGHAQAILGPGIAAGTPVVVEGQRALEDGIQVTARPQLP
jgi:multidrug efflux pump subunit AcrA (membrane-fusion protein)